MKYALAVCVCLILLLSQMASSHPSSGIAVDKVGTVFFIDTGAGVWQLERSGSLTKIPGRPYHWLAVDRTGRLANTELPTFTVGQASVEHTLHDVLISSDFPISIDTAGTLYFPWKQAGQLRIMRLAPTGSSSTFATIVKSADGKTLDWIRGSVMGPDGTFYFTEDVGVWKIPPHRSPVLIPIQMPESDCVAVPGLSDGKTPLYQGVDVDANGNLFVAVTGCRAVIKIAPNKPVATLIRTSGNWSPTGVAVFGNEVFVLEFLHTPSHDRREWIPRIRKIAADGSDSIVVTVERKPKD